MSSWLKKTTGKELALVIGLLGIAAMFLIPSSGTARLTIGFLFFIYPMYFILNIWHSGRHNRIKWIASSMPFIVCLLILSAPLFQGSKYKVALGTAVNFKLTPRNSKFFIRTDIVKLKDSKMYLGIVPFEGDKLLDASQSWIPSKRVIGDPLLYSFDFSKKQINRSTAQVTVAFLIVEWNGFPNGFMPLVFYSWNYKEGKDWAMWRRDLPDQVFDPDQSDEVQRFINNVSACIMAHSQDKKYDDCFKQKSGD